MQYPASLPRPVRDEYALAISSKTSRIPMDDGYTRPNRVVTDTQSSLTLRWHLKVSQQQLFNDWWIRAHKTEVEIPIEHGATVKVRLSGQLPAYEKAAFGLVARLTVVSIKESVPYVAGMPIWPEGLPKLNTSGFTLTAPGIFETPDPDIFHAPSRLRFNSRPALVSGTLTVNLEERNLFWEFYAKLGNGTRYFQAPLIDHLGEFNSRCWLNGDPRESANTSGFDITLALGYTSRGLVVSGL